MIYELVVLFFTAIVGEKKLFRSKEEQEKEEVEENKELAQPKETKKEELYKFVDNGKVAETTVNNESSTTDKPESKSESNGSANDDAGRNTGQAVSEQPDKSNVGDEHNSGDSEAVKKEETGSIEDKQD